MTADESFDSLVHYDFCNSGKSLVRCDKEILNFTLITQSELAGTVNHIEGEERAIGDGLGIGLGWKILAIFQTKDRLTEKQTNSKQ